MESEAFIKIEQQSPVQSTSNIMGLCMAHFYDDDSLDPICPLKQDPFDDTLYDHQYILSTVQQMLDIRTTPLEQIITMIKSLFQCLPQGNIEKLRKMIVKRKNFLKRNYAKNRDHSDLGKKSYYVISDMSNESIVKEDVLAQIKKKRNRMSAQISRDRKKQKIQQLENNNDQLREETERIKQQNQRLKQQLANFNNSEKTRTQDSTKPQRNKFISLLIMLGIVFLFSIFKDTKSISFKNKEKIKKPETDIIQTEIQHKFLEKSQSTLFEMEKNPKQAVINDQESLNHVINKLSELRISNSEVQLPRALKDKIEYIESQML